MPAKIKKPAGKNRHRHSPVPKGVSRHAFSKVYWPYIPLILLTGLLTAIGIKTGMLSNGLKHPGGEVLAYSTSMEQQKLLVDTNSMRQQNHQPTLLLNAKLAAAAQAKVNDMVSRDYWSHQTPEGSPPWVFFSRVDYKYQKAGENLAAGFANEQLAVSGWMASSGHRHNLLDPSYKDVGFGVASVADYKAAGGGPMTVVVAFYGEPAGTTDTPVILSSNEPLSAYTSASSPANASEASHKTSQGQIGFASFHMYSLATSSILAIMFVSLGIWLGRHAIQLRRVVTKSEKIIFNHPLVDVGLLIIAALAFLLNQTAGFIK